MGNEGYCCCVSMVIMVTFKFGSYFLKGAIENGDCFAYKVNDINGGYIWETSATTTYSSEEKNFGQALTNLSNFSFLSAILLLLLCACIGADLGREITRTRLTALVAFLYYIQIWWSLYLGFNNGVVACKDMVPAAYKAMKIQWWISVIIVCTASSIAVIFFAIANYVLVKERLSRI